MCTSEKQFYKMSNIKTILLGIFNTEEFERLQLDHDTYPFTDTIEKVDWEKCTKAIEVVEEACKVTDEIYFLLDSLSLPLWKDSETTLEIEMILQNKEYLEKTSWILNGKIISHKEFFKS